MLILGPVIFGLILGMLIGSQIKLDIDEKFTAASFTAVLIAGIIFAWQSGNYPFYDDILLSTAFITALIGIFAGKLIFARGK